MYLLGRDLGVMMTFPFPASPPLWSTDDPMGVFTTPDGKWIFNANAWNNASPAFLGQGTWANGPDSWGFIMAGASSSTGVLNYPCIQKNLPHVPLKNVQNIWTRWSHMLPQGFKGEAMYDTWINGPYAGKGIEVSVFTDNRGVVPTGLLASGIVLSGAPGTTWTAYERPGSNPVQYVFEPSVNSSAGLLDLKPFYQWLIDHTLIPADSSIQTAEYGAEVITTLDEYLAFGFDEFDLMLVQ